ncbi:MAG: Calx-beta domain-containing protein, partial [Steroidobacteraceae bacterium]
IQESPVSPAPAVPEEPPRRSTSGWHLAAAIGLAFMLGFAISRFGWEAPQTGSTNARAAKAPAAGGPLPTNIAAAEPAAVDADTDSGDLRSDGTRAARSAAGPPLRPGLVVFDTASMVVSERAVVAAIPVRHFNRAGRGVEVGWRAIDGTAVAGRDYGGPQTGLAKFAEGHTFRIIYVPIVSDVRAAGDRSFTVELTGTSDGASLGVTRSVVVTILDDA